MGCGCADRMRRQILPRAGYVRVDKDWLNPKTKDRIPDVEVEAHHARLMLMNPQFQKAGLGALVDWFTPKTTYVVEASVTVTAASAEEAAVRVHAARNESATYRVRDAIGGDPQIVEFEKGAPKER
jgi:hypothetical protein